MSRKKSMLERADVMSIIKLTHKISPKQLEWRNNPAITAWCRQNHLLTYNDMENWFKRIQQPDIQMFGIEIPDGNNVGTCGLTGINWYHRSCEFSLFIGPEYQGHDYGREALKELIAYAFLRLGMNRVFGEVFSGNPALEMFKEVGFVEEGTLRQTYYKGGKFINSIMIGILNDDYRNKYCK